MIKQSIVQIRSSSKQLFGAISIVGGYAESNLIKSFAFAVTNLNSYSSKITVNLRGNEKKVLVSQHTSFFVLAKNS